MSLINSFVGCLLELLSNKEASLTFRSSHRRCSVRKNVLRNFEKAYNFIKKETLAQVLSREFCEISKNIFVTEHL